MRDSLTAKNAKKGAQRILALLAALVAALFLTVSVHAEDAAAQPGGGLAAPATQAAEPSGTEPMDTPPAAPTGTEPTDSTEPPDAPFKPSTLQGEGGMAGGHDG